MNTIYVTGFFFGTFKFLLSHWMILGIAKGQELTPTFWDLFLPTTAGAFVSMAVFYFASDFMMDRAAKKRTELLKKAIAEGTEFVPKRKFTRLNKLIVKLKMRIGIYGVTIIAPLFFSIPLGSVICAKFYGERKQTFPLMLLFMGAYSFLMCAIIYLVK